jgi:hypothetical protein
MPLLLRYGTFLIGLFALLLANSTSLAALSATATISTTSTSAPYDYTVNVTNTGDTDIGTFWFAWTPPGQPTEYNLLPSIPSPTSEPSGWYGYYVSGVSVGNVPGYSVEYYNGFGSPIAPGEMGTFEFMSSDSPSVLAGAAGGFPITTSVIYSGFPESGPAAFVSVTAVPEPGGIVSAIAGGFAFALFFSKAIFRRFARPRAMAMEAFV